MSHISNKQYPEHLLQETGLPIDPPESSMPKNLKCSCAEFKGEKLIQRHMERLGGVERMHEQIYSAVTTQRRESLNMALMSFGKPPRNLCSQHTAKREGTAIMIF